MAAMAAAGDRDEHAEVAEDVGKSVGGFAGVAAAGSGVNSSSKNDGSRWTQTDEKELRQAQAGDSSVGNSRKPSLWPRVLPAATLDASDPQVRLPCAVGATWSRGS